MGNSGSSVREMPAVPTNMPKGYTENLDGIINTFVNYNQTMTINVLFIIIILVIHLFHIYIRFKK